MKNDIVDLMQLNILRNFFKILNKKNQKNEQILKLHQQLMLLANHHTNHLMNYANKIQIVNHR